MKLKLLIASLDSEQHQPRHLWQHQCVSLYLN